MPGSWGPLAYEESRSQEMGMAPREGCRMEQGWLRDMGEEMRGHYQKKTQQTILEVTAGGDTSQALGTSDLKNAVPARARE